MSRPWAILAAGGTGGHVVPALAIARELVARGHEPADVLFVGAKRGIEARIVPEAGFPVVLLPGRGISRSFTLANVGAIVGLARAVVQAIWLVLRRRPQVVVSFGGYAAAACGLVAGLLRIPLVLAEQNAVPTATHRLLARFATASAVSFPDTPLPRAIVTGNPIRAEFLQLDISAAGKAAAREALGLPLDRTVIVATSGSLGARRINDAVHATAMAWRHRRDIAIRHIVGERDWEAIGGTQFADGLIYQQVRFEERMPLALAAADLVVSRSGGTVAELAISGRASLLVPYPYAPYDHQTHNARHFVAAGAAVLVPDGELTAERLQRELATLLSTPGQLEEMGEAARTLAHPDAASKAADVVEKNARRD